MIRMFFAFSLLAAAAQAQVYTGNYAFGDNPQACRVPSDTNLQVLADRLQFYESVCGLTNPRLLPGMDGAVQYTLTCEGEGQQWQVEAILMQLEEGGLAIIRPGWVSEYQRC